MNFLELVKARYSARKYANRPVEAEKLDYIMECVRFAPSAVNFQPWRFRIVTDEAVLKALYSCYKREWLATAPCIIVACVDHNESWHRRADNKDHADIDIAIAVEHLCLAAAEQDWVLVGFVILMLRNAVRFWDCRKIWNRPF